MVNKTLKSLLKFVSKIVLTGGIVLVVLFVAQTAFNVGFNLTDQEDNSDKEPKDVLVKIPAGATTSDIADILETEGVIDNSFMFTLSAKLDGFDGQFKYGTYIFSTTMNEEDIMTMLATEGAQAEQFKITVPEGYSVYQIADMLEEKEICTADEFLLVADSLDYDYKFIEYIPVDREDGIALEGYLFPETYFVALDATAKDIVNTMLAQFDKVFIDEYYAKVDEMGYSLDEIITIASVIEKEAKLDSERVLMSSVIYNRSQIDMPLGMCSTVLYAQGRIGEAVTQLTIEETKFESPYNTYINVGLPYGPIANPGGASIEAALFPEDTDYYYFVLIDEATGEHHFSKTYEEHLANQ